MTRLVLALHAILIASVTTSCRTSRGESGMAAPANRTPILLFNGKGTSPGDVAALERILSGERLSFSTIDSPALNRMSESQLQEYRLLIVPGGNFERIGNSLTYRTTANVRSAIKNGLNYLGICAGAFLAGNSPYNGLNLTSGARFGFYAAEAQGIRKQAVGITIAGGQSLDQYWEDGPQLNGWGAVVARYPDGSPAIVEGASGKGWLILSGVHPEAPAAWRSGMDFRTPVSVDHAYAATLIAAALNQTLLPHY